MRKDADCAFGILKGRWYILKGGISLHGEAIANCIWKTYCTLPKYISYHDGHMHEYYGDLGLFDIDETTYKLFALMCLTSCQNLHQYDSSGIGPGRIKVGLVVMKYS